MSGAPLPGCPRVGRQERGTASQEAQCQAPPVQLPPCSYGVLRQLKPKEAWQTSVLVSECGLLRTFLVANERKRTQSDLSRNGNPSYPDWMASGRWDRSPSPRVPRPESSVCLSSPGWAGTRPAAAQALSLMGMRSGQEPLYYCGTIRMRDVSYHNHLESAQSSGLKHIHSVVYSLPLSGSRTFLSPQKDPLNPSAVTPNLASLHS